MNNTADINEINKLTFNTIDWINENTSWEGGAITDSEESLTTTTYSLSHEGSSNYLVDEINPSNTDFIIYVKEGDIIKKFTIKADSVITLKELLKKHKNKLQINHVN